MESIIAVEHYTTFFYNVLLGVTIFLFLNSYNSKLESVAASPNHIKYVWLVVFVIVYIGLRPISGKYFGDMSTYAAYFERYASGERVELEKSKDWLFEYFMKFCSGIMTVENFFFVCATLYVLPLYAFTKKVFKDYWFYGFFALVASMSFWAYGTNGIRNGIATSFFLLGVSRPQLLQRLFWMFLAVSFHKSMVIPIAAYFLATYYPNPKYYIRAWLIAIPLSLAVGSFFETLFTGVGLLQDSRLDTYLGDDDLDDLVVNVGFRWDFLIYSATGVAAGYYFIVKKQFEDKEYIRFYNMYLIANTVWILVIRANFSNRFAFLSWFMLGVIVIFPFLKMQFFKDQHLKIGQVILAYFILSYALNVILTSTP
jgi:hypothetical protein